MRSWGSYPVNSVTLEEEDSIIRKILGIFRFINLTWDYANKSGAWKMQDKMLVLETESSPLEENKPTQPSQSKVQLFPGQPYTQAGK